MPTAPPAEEADERYEDASLSHAVEEISEPTDKELPLLPADDYLEDGDVATMRLMSCRLKVIRELYVNTDKVNVD